MKNQKKKQQNVEEERKIFNAIHKQARGLRESERNKQLALFKNMGKIKMLYNIKRKLIVVELLIALFLIIC